MKKMCTCCKELKDRSEFTKLIGSNDGLSRYCRKCNKDKRDNKVFGDKYKDMDRFVEIWSDIFWDINDISNSQKMKLYDENEDILEDGWWEIMDWIRSIRIREYLKGNLSKPGPQYIFDFKTAEYTTSNKKCKSCGSLFSKKKTICPDCGSEYKTKKYKK